MSQSNTEVIVRVRKLTTAEYAEYKLVKPQSIRKRYNKTGSYFGDKPTKAKNGRLHWTLMGDAE